MLTLTLLRHAKTNQISETGSDYDRMLLPKGENQSKILHQYLSKTNILYDKILVSSAVRTKQTFAFIQSNFLPVKPEFLTSFYLCSYQELFEKISEEKNASSILIVGHNFGISDLASYLTEKPIDLATSELVTLTFDIDNWIEISKGTATLIDQYRPQV